MFFQCTIHGRKLIKKWIPLLLCIATSLFAREQHPIEKVNQWFKEEKEKSAGSFHKFATLATVSSDGRPHTRMIEIVGLNRNKGVLFFTHKNTGKAQHLSHNPHTALNVWLPNTLRQISMEGEVMQIPTVDAEKSWRRMPRFMKITFMASDHGGEIESNDVLNVRKENLEKLYPNEIPMPDAFIGYHVMPKTVVFYEIQPRNFPIKHVAHLDQDTWTICQVEP